MYNGKITDEDIKIFHKSQKITATYTELNELNSGILFDKSKPNKVLPKFYSDEINGNQNIRTIENKLIIYTDNEDLDSVYFHSKTDNDAFDVLHNISNEILFLHFYDKNSLFNLANSDFKITQSGTNGINKNITTDIYGNISIPLKSTSGSFTVTNLETGQEISW